MNKTDKKGKKARNVLAVFVALSGWLAVLCLVVWNGAKPHEAPLPKIIREQYVSTDASDPYVGDIQFITAQFAPGRQFSMAAKPDTNPMFLTEIPLASELSNMCSMYSIADRKGTELEIETLGADFPAFLETVLNTPAPTTQEPVTTENPGDFLWLKLISHIPAWEGRNIPAYTGAVVLLLDPQNPADLLLCKKPVDGATAEWLKEWDSWSIKRFENYGLWFQKEMELLTLANGVV